MDAYRLKGKGVAQWEDVPRPAASSGGVVVALQANGICRSDLHVLRGPLRLSRFVGLPNRHAIGTSFPRSRRRRDRVLHPAFVSRGVSDALIEQGI